MNEPKWTKGPYKALRVGPVENESITIVGFLRDNEGKNLGQVHLASVFGKHWIVDEEMEANGDLFSAAPELYSALSLLLDNWPANMDGGREYSEPIPHGVITGRAALARARGEA